MRRGIVGIFLGGMMAMSAGVAGAEPWSGNANVLVGSRHVSHDWDPVDTQSAFGIETDVRQTDWPLSFALDFLYSEDRSSKNGVSVDGNLSQIDLGLRKEGKLTQYIRPRFGVGSSVVFGHMEAAGRSDSDSAVGVWVSGALIWELAGSFNIGFEARYSRASLSLLDNNRSTGGTFLGTVAGLHW